jgi:hypothetical protein
MLCVRAFNITGFIRGSGGNQVAVIGIDCTIEGLAGGVVRTHLQAKPTL